MLISGLPFLRDYWYPVLRSSDLGPEPVAVRLLGEEFVAWRSHGEPAMVGAFCPHRSGKFTRGWVDGGAIVCPYHGWQFDGAGRCVHMPQILDGSPLPPKAKVPAARLAERYGVIWACIGDNPAPLPRWPEADEGGWRLFVEFFEVWRVSALRIIDNNLDQSHPAFVHRSTFGDPEQAALRPTGFELRPGGFVSRLERAAPGVGKQMGVSDDEADRFDQVSEVELMAPLTTRTRLYSPLGPDYCFMGTATPLDDTTSIYIRLTALAGTESEQPFEKFTDFGFRVKEEDRLILEDTVPDFPLDPTSEVHVRTDRVTLEYRKHLATLLAGSATTRR